MLEEKSRADVQILNLPNRLKEKVGPGGGQVDLDAIARAEAALEKLECEWDDWLKDDVASLIAAQHRLHREGHTQEIAGVLMRAAHDLKGLAPTYRFPLVGHISAHLCDVLVAAEPNGTVPREVIDSHVAAIRAAIHEQIRDREHPAGKAIMSALEALVRKRRN